MFRLSSAIFREFLKYRTSFTKLFRYLTPKKVIFFSAKCFVTNKKENQVNPIWKSEKHKTMEL